MHTGGTAAYHRDGGDLQFLTSVAAAVRALRPNALVLLTASTGTRRPAQLYNSLCCVANTCCSTFSCYALCRVGCSHRLCDHVGQLTTGAATAEAVSSKRREVAGVFLLTGAAQCAQVVVIACSASALTAQARVGFGIAGPADVVQRLGPGVAGILGGKGGGRPGMYSGKATRLEQQEEAGMTLQVLKNGHQKD